MRAKSKEQVIKEVLQLNGAAVVRLNKRKVPQLSGAEVKASAEGKSKISAAVEQCCIVVVKAKSIQKKSKEHGVGRTEQGEKQSAKGIAQGENSAEDT